MREPATPQPLAIILLGAAGAALGAVILMIAPGDAGQAFIATPQFQVWLFFVAATMAFAAIVAAPLWKSLQGLQQDWASRRSEIVLMGLVLIVLCALPTLLTPPQQEKLAGHRIRMSVLLGLGVAVAAMASVGIWLVRAALIKLAHGSEPGEKRIERYLFLRERLHLFLSILGTLLCGLILATGALRNAYIALESPTTEATSKLATSFPPELVLAYGAYFTALVVLIYAPAYLALIQAGRQLRDDLFPIPSPQSEGWHDWYSNRSDLEELLQLQQRGLENLESGIAILAPLAGSIVTLLVGKS